MTLDASNQQTSLFPGPVSSLIFEQPLNERIRNCLRLEHLFLGIEAGIQNAGEWDARNAISRMLEVSDFLTRTDIKGEIIKELERHMSTLAGLKNNPGVDPTALDETLKAISDILHKLKPAEYQPGSALRNDELTSQLRQRLSIPGGTCNFDVPAFHFWLNADPSLRQAHLNDWMRDLRIVEDAITMILSLIRNSSSPRTVTADSGFYQQQIDSTLPCQIVRVVMPAELQAFPEISGGKHRFTVRFYNQPQTCVRPSQLSNDVQFELHCCGI
jgi:cell division protein ZapD